MRAMEEAAEDNPAIMARIMQYRYRSLEELYDLENDPGCLANLAESPDYRSIIDSMRGEMEDAMERNGDPLLNAYRNRHDAEVVEEELDRVYPDKMRSSIRENGSGFELYVPTKDMKFTKDFINIGMFTCSSVSFVGN